MTTTACLTRVRIARGGYENEARAIGDDGVGRPLGPRLQRASEAVGGLGNELLVGPRSHFLSHRLSFERSELGVPMGVFERNADGPQVFASLVDFAADVCAEANAGFLPASTE